MEYEMKGDWQTLRLRKALLKELAVISEKTKHPVSELVSMCLEDCLEAVRQRLPIIPRMARLAAAVEKEVVVKDPKNYLFMGESADPSAGGQATVKPALEKKSGGGDAAP
jgi:hypothetical protein